MSSTATLAVLPPLLAVGFAVAGVLAYRQAQDASHRTARAVRTRGEVVEVDYNSSQQVFPTVRFAVADGSVVQARLHSSTNLARFHVGQQVGLRYDPRDPSWIAVDGLPGSAETGRVVGVALLLVAALLAVVTVLMFTAPMFTVARR